MNSNDEIYAFFRCPQCHKGSLSKQSEGKKLVCSECKASFPVADGRPVLLRGDNDLFRVEDYIGRRVPAKKSGVLALITKVIPSLSVNLASDRVLLKLSQQLKGGGELPRVLVVGGGNQKEWLDGKLSSCDGKIYYSDIDIGADVDLFCDGHDLPFVDGVFDAVVTTAVLEHVLYPEKVAVEITRVLKVDGLLYSELPFMQQVHEGAYDYTRYTLSGHRRLFNGFSEIESGLVAGPGTALAWSIENFVLAFVRGNKPRLLAKLFIRLFFSWFKYFDYLLRNSEQAMDGASCTYILGRKFDGKISDAQIVEQYVGAKHISHT